MKTGEEKKVRERRGETRKEMWSWKKVGKDIGGTKGELYEENNKKVIL